MLKHGANERVRLLERRVVRRLLEPHQLLLRRIDRVEVLRGQHRRHVPVVPAEHEDDRHVEAPDRREVGAPVLRAQGLERKPVPLAEPNEIRETGFVGAEGGPDELSGREAIAQRSAEALDPASELELLLHGARLWRDRSQRLQGALVTAPLRLSPRPLEGQSLAFREVGDLRDADIRPEFFRMLVRVPRAENRAPRVAEQDDARLMKPCTHRVDERIEVGEQLRGRQ